MTKTVKLNQLEKTTTRRKKRVGRGMGSGKGGHTATRGTKGQRSRSKIRIWFEGGQLALIRKLPKTRGKGRFKPLKPSPVIVNLKDLAVFKKNDIVDQKSLVKHRIVKKDEVEKFGVKILGQGSIKIPLTVKVKTSKKTQKKIEKAGGKVE